jgi:hypothetical protein
MGSEWTYDVSWGFDTSQSVITVGVGDTVRWNFDQDQHAQHTVDSSLVVADGTLLFSSGLKGFGESFSFKFTEVGSFTYFCSPHSSLTGTVRVVRSIRGDLSVSFFLDCVSCWLPRRHGHHRILRLNPCLCRRNHLRRQSPTAIQPLAADFVLR